MIKKHHVTILEGGFKVKQMAVKIRLRRIGKNPTKRPHFRVTVIEETKSRDGRVLQELGYYEPLTGKSTIKQETYQAWVKKGAQASETVKRLFKKIK